MQQMIFIADLIACTTCFRHHYAHHQELESIIQMVAACGIWCFDFQVVGMVWSRGLSVWCGAEGYLYNTLELLMMGIMVPETCCASNKICNKNHLLHLVGILFPHIKDKKCGGSSVTGRQQQRAIPVRANNLRLELRWVPGSNTPCDMVYFPNKNRYPFHDKAGVP